jgi:hypothetical protein
MKRVSLRRHRVQRPLHRAILRVEQLEEKAAPTDFTAGYSALAPALSRPAADNLLAGQSSRSVPLRRADLW